MSVMVLAHPRPGDELRDPLGQSRTEALMELQSARARAWAMTSFPAGTVQPRSGGLADVISDPGLIGADDVFVVVTPELATWSADLGRAALDDLRAGCALSVGPIFDGGLYLLAATGAGLRLLGAGARGDAAADRVDLSGPAVLATLLGLAERAGIEVGLLRTERGLRSADDVRALLVDPLCDEELRGLLG
jgi:hypothetical protein